MEGAVTDVAAEYAAADLFCLPSRWEGFPNTVAEALAHGLPAVAYEGCAGTGDLVEPGENGLLAAGNGDTDEHRTRSTVVSGSALITRFRKPEEQVPRTGASRFWA